MQLFAGIRHRAVVLSPTRTDDPAPNGCKKHDCSLRGAITKANNHPGTDRIVLHGGETYKLTRKNAGGVGEDLNKTGDLDIRDSLKIASSGKTLATVDANSIDRVFDVGPSSAVSASFQRLRIRGGSLLSGAGGGIQLLDNSSLALSRSVVSGNTTPS